MKIKSTLSLEVKTESNYDDRVWILLFDIQTLEHISKGSKFKLEHREK